ncbi:MAG: helix-turn-helix domain-containing protein [Terrimonas sp.]|nr:helix-turn-helix domain-containing protein [Terrimonas sp.]
MENIILSQIPLSELTTAISQTIKSEFEKQAAGNSPAKEQVEFLTRKEAAKILGVSLPTLLEWTKKGLITGYRISSRVRYKRTEIENSLQQIQSLKKLGKTPA